MAKAKKASKSKRAKAKDLPTKAGQAGKVKGGAEPVGGIQKTLIRPAEPINN